MPGILTIRPRINPIASAIRKTIAIVSERSTEGGGASADSVAVGKRKGTGAV
jgi:hypothetical protein